MAKRMIFLRYPLRTTRLINISHFERQTRIAMHTGDAMMAYQCMGRTAHEPGCRARQEFSVRGKHDV